jgi:hypothetical protein
MVNRLVFRQTVGAHPLSFTKHGRRSSLSHRDTHTQSGGETLFGGNHAYGPVVAWIDGTTAASCSASASRLGGMPNIRPVLAAELRGAVVADCETHAGDVPRFGEEAPPKAPCAGASESKTQGLQVGLRSPSTRVWSSRREVAFHCVKRLGAASGAGEDEGALERSQQHRRVLVRDRRLISKPDVNAGD